MNLISAFLPSSLIDRLAAASESTSGQSGGDTFVIILLGLVLLFFAWLIVAAVRKKLSSSRRRMGEYTEDEQEAARTAKLWAEARRKSEGEEEEEEEAPDEAVDIQTELMAKARERHEEKGAAASEVPATVEKAPPAEKAVPAPRTLEEGLGKTRSGFVSRLGKMFGRSSIDADDIEEIEEILFTADIGVRTSQKLIDALQGEADRKDRADPGKLQLILMEHIERMLSVAAPPLEIESARPFVILVVGVNGTGKTTTIGKLAVKLAKDGKKVILAAADTFRAAAREQIEVWGKRAGVQVIGGQEGADPASIIFDAISAAKSQGADVVIADTAGRLHTKVNLIEELRKVRRVCGKAMQGAPHEVLLVLDATTGQNAINQAKQFNKALDVTGIALTKLDGTAKGGIIIGVCDTFGIPVRYIGIGEQVDDLRPFDPTAFVKALFS
ncbi:MAG TPA: signal recognition particle-docking protein FtsY [Myxococcota bacterium]|nr:signal recognition particle-docking protein FtsY [Myxococcota bacterium]